MPYSDDALARLRAEIDRVDDALHDLIMRRAELIRNLAETKDGFALRPGREAAILRRLLDRHDGPFPKAAIVRIWREILGASVVLQGPFSLAVYAPAADDGYWELARDHFGTVVDMKPFRTARDIVRAVASGEATVGVLPTPVPEDEDPWWHGLVGAEEPAPRVIARLPFASPAPGPRKRPEAVVLARTDQEESGRDRSYIVVEAEMELSRARLSAALTAAGLQPSLMVVREDRGEAWQALVEVEGYVGPDDARIEGLMAESGLPLARVHRLGGYAAPIEPGDLAG